MSSPSHGADTAPHEAEAPAATPIWRRLLHLLIAAGLLAVVFSRIDWQAFVQNLGRVNYLWFGLFILATALTGLAADVFATVHIYRRTVPGLTRRFFFFVRGASCLYATVNHHLGQAWVTYAVSRAHGIDLGRMAGATLLSYMIWGGSLLALGSAAVYAAGLPVGWAAALLVLGLAYLALLAVEPRRLAQNRVLAPLFEAGVADHLTAVAARIPHMGIMFLGTWLPYSFFGVEIPLRDALVYVPIVMVAVTLPITPQGIGTRDLLASAFFAPFCQATTPAARRAVIASCTATTGVAIMVIDTLIALVLYRKAARLLSQVDRAK